MKFSSFIDSASANVLFAVQSRNLCRIISAQNTFMCKIMMYIYYCITIIHI